MLWAGPPRSVMPPFFQKLVPTQHNQPPLPGAIGWPGELRCRNLPCEYAFSSFLVFAVGGLLERLFWLHFPMGLLSSCLRGSHSEALGQSRSDPQEKNAQHIPVYWAGIASVISLEKSVRRGTQVHPSWYPQGGGGGGSEPPSIKPPP